MKNFILKDEDEETQERDEKLIKLGCSVYVTEWNEGGIRLKGREYLGGWFGLVN